MQFAAQSFWWMWYNFVKGNGYKNAYILKYSVLFIIAWWRLCYKLNIQFYLLLHDKDFVTGLILCRRPFSVLLLVEVQNQQCPVSHQSTHLLAFVTKCSSDKGKALLVVGGVHGPSPSVRNKGVENLTAHHYRELNASKILIMQSWFTRFLDYVTI